MSTPSTLVAERYRLVKLLGAGGMGIVWQAWDERLQRPVALKMLRTQPELTDDEREVATSRAMREARITAGLHHPNAVTVFDVVEHEGQPCIVMQLIESTPLSILLREHGTFTPRETARIGAQVGSALAAAHRMRIVHRDVKPGNILVTADGSAMISDFGISHALGDASITATGMMHGTPAYLAPEVARGQATSFASDVFSLGSTLYTMLEGVPPFGAGDNAIALLHRVARGTHAAPGHAGMLAPLLHDMLSVDPKGRPDMTSVAARLSALYEGVAAVGSDSPTMRLDGGALGRAALSGAAVAGAALAGAALAADGETTVADATRRVGATAETERLEEGTDTERLPGAAARPALPWLVQGPPTPPPAAAPEADTSPRRRGVAILVGILLLVGLIVLGGAFVVGWPRPEPDDARAPVAEGPATTATATPTPETPSSEAASPQADATPSPPVEEEAAPTEQPPSTEQRLVVAITTYYGLVPGDLDRAWPLMTADYQENHVGGRGPYDAFWGSISDVTIDDVTASPPDRAQATLTYTFDDGRVVQEVTAYRLVDEGGELKIAETTVLSSVEL